MSTIGERIRTVRKIKGLTQEEFARTLAVTRINITRIENNDHIPSRVLIRLISLTFHVQESWLLTGK